ncbi:CLUMA_CG017751, isoform A [Clunio marinus]|uniref:CLUMA_CG017751, isoform A n=1 Tax=Clunio marinus TaxID=568069 RepID=A0A1J1IX10_9DIPT|nr:CLUMA_CG017751, isoform A [Clunio marinus]
MFIMNTFRLACLPSSFLLQQKILYYNLFEMPIKYRIEFAFFCFVQNAVNRQQPKSKSEKDVVETQFKCDMRI